MATFAGWGLRNVKWFRDFLDTEFGLQINIDDLSTNSFESDDPFIEVHNATLTNSAVNLLVRNQFPVALDLGKASKLQIQFSWHSILQDDPNPEPFEVRVWDARLVLRITHPNEWEEQIDDMYKSLDKTKRRTLDGYYLPDCAKWHVRVANRVKKLLKLSIHNCSVTIAGPNAPTKLPFLISLQINYIAYCDPDETAWNGRGRLVRKFKDVAYCGRESSKYEKMKCIPTGQQCEWCKMEPKPPPTFKFDKKMRESMLRSAKVCYIRDASLYIHMGQVHITRFTLEHPGDILPKTSLKTPKMMIMIQLQKYTDWSQVVYDESSVVSQINMCLDFEDQAQNEMIFSTADWDLLMHLFIGPYCVLNAYFAFIKKTMTTKEPLYLSPQNAEKYRNLWKRHLDNGLTRQELTEMKLMEDAMPLGFAFYIRNDVCASTTASVRDVATAFSCMCTEGRHTSSTSINSSLSSLHAGIFPSLHSTRVFHGCSSQWSTQTRAKLYPAGARISGYSYIEIFIPQLYLRIVPSESEPRRGCRCKDAFDHPNLVRVACKNLRIGIWKDFTSGMALNLELADFYLSEKVEKEWRTVFMFRPNDHSDRASFCRADYAKNGRELARKMHIVGRLEGNLRVTLEIVQFLWMGHMPSYAHLKTEFRMRKRLPHWWVSVCESLIPARDQDVILDCEMIDFYIIPLKDAKSNPAPGSTPHHDTTKNPGLLQLRVGKLQLDTSLMREAERFCTQYAVAIDSCVQGVYSGTLIANKATHLLQEDVVVANPVDTDKKVTFMLLNGEVNMLSGPWHLHGAACHLPRTGLDTVFIEGRTPWLMLGAVIIGEGTTGIVQKPHIFAIKADLQDQPSQKSHIQQDTGLLGTSDAVLGVGKWIRISNTSINYKALSNLKPLATLGSRYNISDVLGYPQDETIIRETKASKPIAIEVSLHDTLILLGHEGVDAKALSVTFIELSCDVRKIDDEFTLCCELQDMLIETEEAYDASRVTPETGLTSALRPEDSMHQYFHVSDKQPRGRALEHVASSSVQVMSPDTNKPVSRARENIGPPLFSRAVTHKTDDPLMLLGLNMSGARKDMTLTLAHAQLSLTTHTVQTCKSFVDNVKTLWAIPDKEPAQQEGDQASGAVRGSAEELGACTTASVGGTGKKKNAHGKSSSWVSLLEPPPTGIDARADDSTERPFAMNVHVLHLCVFVPGKRRYCYEPAENVESTRHAWRETVVSDFGHSDTQFTPNAEDGEKNPLQVAQDAAARRRVVEGTVAILVNIRADIEKGGSSGVVVTLKTTEVSLWHVAAHNELILSIILSDVVGTPRRSSLRIGHCAWWASPNPQKCAPSGAYDGAATPLSDSQFQHLPARLPWAAETHIFERAPLLWPVLWHEVMHHLGGYLWKMRIDNAIVSSFQRLCDSTNARGPQLITVSKATPHASFRPKYVVEDIGLTTSSQSNAAAACTAMHHAATFEFRPVQGVAEAYYVYVSAGVGGGWLNNARPDGDLSIVTPDPLESVIVKVVPVENTKTDTIATNACTSSYRMTVIDIELPAREPLYIGTRSDGTLTTFRDPAQACDIELVGSGLSDECKDAWLTICLEDEASGGRRVLTPADPADSWPVLLRTTSSDTLIAEESSVPSRVHDSRSTVPVFRQCGPTLLSSAPAPQDSVRSQCDAKRYHFGLASSTLCLWPEVVKNIISAARAGLHFVNTLKMDDADVGVDDGGRACLRATDRDTNSKAFKQDYKDRRPTPKDTPTLYKGREMEIAMQCFILPVSITLPPEGISPCPAPHVSRVVIGHAVASVASKVPNPSIARVKMFSPSAPPLQYRSAAVDGRTEQTCAPTLPASNTLPAWNTRSKDRSTQRTLLLDTLRKHVSAAQWRPALPFHGAQVRFSCLGENERVRPFERSRKKTYIQLRNLTLSLIDSVSSTFSTLSMQLQHVVFYNDNGLERKNVKCMAFQTEQIRIFSELDLENQNILECQMHTRSAQQPPQSHLSVQHFATPDYSTTQVCILPTRVWASSSWLRVFASWLEATTEWYKAIMPALTTLTSSSSVVEEDNETHKNTINMGDRSGSSPPVSSLPTGASPIMSESDFSVTKTHATKGALQLNYTQVRQKLQVRVGSLQDHVNNTWEERPVMSLMLAHDGTLWLEGAPGRHSAQNGETEVDSRVRQLFSGVAPSSLYVEQQGSPVPELGHSAYAVLKIALYERSEIPDGLRQDLDFLWVPADMESVLYVAFCTEIEMLHFTNAFARRLGYTHAAQRQKVTMLGQSDVPDVSHVDGAAPDVGGSGRTHQSVRTSASSAALRPTSVNVSVLRRGTKAAANVVGKVTKLPRQVGIHLSSPTPPHAESQPTGALQRTGQGNAGVPASSMYSAGGDAGPHHSAPKLSRAIHSKRMNRVDISFLGLEVWIPASVPNAENLGLLTYGKVEVHSGLRDRREYAITFDRIITVHGKARSTLQDKVRFHKDWLEETCLELSLTRERVVMKLEGFNVRIATGPYCQKALKVVWRELDIMIAFILLRQLQFFVERGKDVVSIFTRSESRSRAFSPEQTVSDKASVATTQHDQTSLTKTTSARCLPDSDGDPCERDAVAVSTRVRIRHSLTAISPLSEHDRVTSDVAQTHAPKSSHLTVRDTQALEDDGDGGSVHGVHRAQQSSNSVVLNTIMEKDDDAVTTAAQNATDTRPVLHKHALGHAFFHGSPWLVHIDLGKGINICIGGGVESGYVKQQELTLQISPIQFQGLYPGPSDDTGAPMEKFSVLDTKGNSLCSLPSLRGNFTLKCDVFNAVWGAGFGVVEPLTGVVKTLTAVSDKGLPSEITTTRMTLHLDHMMINVPYMLWDYMQAMLRELATLSASATKGRPPHLRRYGLQNYTGLDMHVAMVDAPYYEKCIHRRTLQKSSDVMLHVSAEDISLLRTKCVMHGSRLKLAGSLMLQGVKLMKGMEVLKCVSEDLYEFCPVTRSNCSVGMRVCRRPADWNWGNEDKEVNYATETGLVKKADTETGVVTAVDKNNLTCSVYWTHGFEYDHYRIGKEGRYDLDCGLLALRLLELHLTRAETMMMQTQNDTEGHYTPPIPRAHVGFRRAMKISLDADLTIEKIGAHMVNIRIGCLQHACPTAYRYLRYGYRILIEPISHAIQDSVCHMRISTTVTLVNHTNVPFEVMLNEQWMHETLRKAHSCVESCVNTIAPNFLRIRKLEKSNKLNALNGRPMTGATAAGAECDPHYHVLTLAPMSESQVPLEWFSEGGRATYIRPVGLLTNREPWRMFEPLAKEIEGDATSTARAKELKSRYDFSLFFSRYLKFTGYTDYHDVRVQGDGSASSIARVAQTAQINISGVLTYRNMLPFPVILMVAPKGDAVADAAAASMTENKIRQVFKIGVRGAQFEERPYRTCCFRYSTAQFEWVPEDWGIRMATQLGDDTDCLAWCMPGYYKSSSVPSRKAKPHASGLCECAWYFLRVDEEINLPFAKRHVWTRLILSPETPLCGSHSEEITHVWPNVHVRLKRAPPQPSIQRVESCGLHRLESSLYSSLLMPRSVESAHYATALAPSDATYTIKQVYDDTRVALSNGKDNLDLSVEELKRDYELAHGQFPFISQPLRLFLPSLDSVKPSVTLFVLTQKRDDDDDDDAAHADVAGTPAFVDDYPIGHVTASGARLAHDRQDAHDAKEEIQMCVQCTRTNITIFVPYIVENLTSYPLYCLEARYTHKFLPNTRILPMIQPLGKILSTHRPLHIAASWPYLDVKAIENISNAHEERKPMDFAIPRFLMSFLFPIKPLGEDVRVGELVVWNAEFLQSEKFRTTAEQFFVNQDPEVEEECGMHTFHLNYEWSDLQRCEHWTGVIMRILDEQEEEYEITWVGVRGNMIVPKKYLMKAPGIPHSWTDNYLALSATVRYAQPPLSPHLTKIISISPSFNVINQLPEDFIVLLFYAVQTTPNALRFSPSSRNTRDASRGKSARADGSVPGLLQAMRPFHLAHGVSTPLVFPSVINFYFPCVYLMVARKSEPHKWTRSETFRVCPSDDSAIPDTRHVKWKTNKGDISPKELIQVDINRGTLPSDLPFLYNGYFIRIMEPDFTRSDDVLVSVKNCLHTALFFRVKTNAPESDARDSRPSRKTPSQAATCQNAVQATASTPTSVAVPGQTPCSPPAAQFSPAKARPQLSMDDENGLEEADTTVLVFGGQTGRLQVRSLPVAHRTTKGRGKERVALKLCLYAQYPMNRAGLRVFPVSKAYVDTHSLAQDGASLYCCRRYLVQSLQSGVRRQTLPTVPARSAALSADSISLSRPIERPSPVVCADTPAAASSALVTDTPPESSGHFRCGDEALCIYCDELATRLKRCDKLAHKRTLLNVEKMKWRELRDLTSSIPFRVTGHGRTIIAAKLCPKGYLDDRHCSMQLRIMEHAGMAGHGVLPVTARILGGLMLADCHVGMTVLVQNRLAEIVDVHKKGLVIDYATRRSASASSAEVDGSPTSGAPLSDGMANDLQSTIKHDIPVRTTRASSELSSSTGLTSIPVYDNWVDNVDAVVSFTLHLLDRTVVTNWKHKAQQQHAPDSRLVFQKTVTYARAQIAEFVPYATATHEWMQEYFHRSIHSPPSFRVACEENWEVKQLNGRDISAKTPVVMPHGGLAIGSELTIVGREAVVHESQDRDGTQVFELRYERVYEQNLSRTFTKNDNNRDFALDITVPKFSVAWVHDMAEILALRIKDIRLDVKSLDEGQLWSFEAAHLQIDHFVEGTIPVVLNRRFLHQHSRWIEDKALSLTMLRDVRTNVWQKLELKTVPFWLNVEMGVFFRLYNLAQKDRIAVASDRGTVLIARKRTDVVAIQHPEPPPILAGARVIQIKNIVIGETRLTINIRSPDDNTVLDDFRQLRLLLYLPLDMPNVDIRVLEFTQNDRIGSAGSIFNNFCVEYKRRAILRIGYGILSSYVGIAFKGILEGGWWLFRGPFDHISLAYKRELAYRESLSGRTSTWAIYLSPWWVSPLLHGISEGFYRGMAEVCGNILLFFVFVTNILKLFLLWEVHRPRSLSVLDGMSTAIRTLFADIFVTPYHLLFRQTRRFLQDYSKLAACGVFVCSLIRVPFGVVFAVLESVAALSEGFANSLLLEEAQFVLSDEQRKFDAQSGRAYSAGAWHSWADDNASSRSQNGDQSGFRGLRNLPARLQKLPMGLETMKKTKPQREEGKKER